MFAGVRIVAPLVKAAMSLKHLIPASVALVLAACSPSNGSEKGGKGHGGPMGGGMPAPEVTVITAATEALPVSWEYVGQTIGSREVEVRARVTGILLSRNFKEGERVKKGQSLFTIDPAPFQAALALDDDVHGEPVPFSFADISRAEMERDERTRDEAAAAVGAIGFAGGLGAAVYWCVHNQSDCADDIEQMQE